MEFQEFKEEIMAAAKAAGLEDFEIYYGNILDVTAVIYQEELQKFSTSKNAGVCFRCRLGGKMGYASTESFTREEAKALVQRAAENAEAIEAEEEEFFQDATGTYQTVRNKQAKIPDTRSLTEKAFQAQKAAYQADNRVSDGTETYAGAYTEERAIYNSKGLKLSDSYTVSSLAVYPVVTEGERMYSGSEDRFSAWEDIRPEEIAKAAVLDTTERIGATSIPSGTYPVLLSGKMTATLLATFTSVFSAENAQKGMSLLAGKEGEPIASALVTLVDDPFYEESFVCSSFDAEGAATKTKPVIEQGIFRTLLYNLKTANKAGLCTTGNAAKDSYSSPVSIQPYNFYFQPAAATIDELFQLLGQGVYITDLNGLHAGANPVTGDFSISAEGFWIEGGKKQKPVNHITVSGNFYTFLKDITEIGGDLVFLPPKGRSVYGSPSVIVQNLVVAGK